VDHPETKDAVRNFYNEASDIKIMIMIKEIEIVECGKNAAESMCGGVALAFID
jgi:hypothetical protein